MERSFNPPRTKLSTSLRTVSGWMWSSPDSIRSMSFSWYSESLKK